MTYVWINKPVEGATTTKSVKKEIKEKEKKKEVEKDGSDGI